MIPDAVHIQRFGSAERDTRYTLLQEMAGLTVVSIRGYAWPDAANVASNLAADARDCEPLPHAIRAQFLLNADAETRVANHTAQQWLAGVLQPQRGQLVGFVVLWEQPSLHTTLMLGTAPEHKQPLIVLIKANETAAGQFELAQVLYGDVRHAVN
jgi:hypothetical protein